MSSKTHRMTIKRHKWLQTTWLHGLIVLNPFRFNNVAPIAGVGAFYIECPAIHSDLCGIMSSCPCWLQEATYLVGILIILIIPSFFTFRNNSSGWYVPLPTVPTMFCFILQLPSVPLDHKQCFSKMSQKAHFCLQSAGALYLSWLRLWAW